MDFGSQLGTKIASKMRLGRPLGPNLPPNSRPRRPKVPRRPKPRPRRPLGPNLPPKSPPRQSKDGPNLSQIGHTSTAGRRKMLARRPRTRIVQILPGTKPKTRTLPTTPEERPTSKQSAAKLPPYCKAPELQKSGAAVLPSMGSSISSLICPSGYIWLGYVPTRLHSSLGQEQAKTAQERSKAGAVLVFKNCVSVFFEIIFRSNSFSTCDSIS